MPLFSEFESLYHAMVYYLHDEISEGTRVWTELSNAIDAFGEEEEFFVSYAFRDALLDDSTDNFLHLFEELEGNDKKHYITKLKALPYINFSNLEKNYLRYILSHEKCSIFLSKETIEKLKTNLDKEHTGSIDFSKHLEHLHKGHIPLDDIDSKHLKCLMESIENRQNIHYRYMDDEGHVYQGISSPLRLQHDMQSDRLYLIHFPKGHHKPVQGLLRFFSKIEKIEDSKFDLKAIEALSPYSIKGSSTVSLEIANNSPLLRKALVELSVFERIITRVEREGRTYSKIQLTYYSFDKEKLMRKIRLLQPELKVLAPNTLKDELHNQLREALRRL
jgi:hypothetical protein